MSETMATPAEPIVKSPREPSVADIADADLLGRAVRHAVKFGGKKRDPNWARVMVPFTLGSTYAAQLCARFGIRPDAFGIEGQSR